jgi:CRP-like cAMP-binding protein
MAFEPGELILKKGERGREFFLIRSGKAEADKVLYRPGDVFGRAAFGDRIRKKNVRARTRVTVVAIDPEDIKAGPAEIAARFMAEGERIRKVRPRARLDKVVAQP